MAAFKLYEVKANLFNVPQTFSLAHSVSADLETVRGALAWQFAVIFGRVDDLKKQQISCGNVAVLEDNTRFVYFLVTKETMYDRVTYDTMQAALICMREHMRNHGVLKVAMPRVGCGHDGLNWSRVREMIKQVFAHDYNVEIMICQHRSPMLPAIPKCEIFEVQGSLFSAPEHYSLVHAVSADSAMCGSVGLQFKCRFGQLNELIKQNKHCGNVAVQKDNDRFIYNLIVKERHHERCTYPALYYALVAMREHMLQNNVTKVAIPQLGCGIDRLEWLRVKKILEFVFANDKVEIVSYFVDPPTVLPRQHIASMHSTSCKRAI